MKNKLNEFVSKNFEIIKIKFLEDERNILIDLKGDEVINKEQFDDLSKILENQLNVFNVDELIKAINERSMDLDLNDDSKCNVLLDMLKNIIK